MDKRWKLSEEKLKKLLQVSHVQLNVPAKPTDEVNPHEASKSTESGRVEETAKDSKKHQTPRTE